jgi:Protein of unknown function (DUF3431)
MTIDLVISRYDEVTTWTNLVKLGPRRVVYNKGSGELRPLPNVGREAHTYLYHILDTYGSFPDWTFFTQGNPLAHSPNYVHIVNNWPLSYTKSAFFPREGLYFLGNHPVQFLETNPKGDDANNDVKGLWEELFTSPFPKDIMFAPAALFAISKEVLLSRTPAFYKKAYDLAGTRPRAAWEFERLWAYLWTSSVDTKL